MFKLAADPPGVNEAAVMSASFAHEVSAQANIPRGIYVFSDNPDCGVDHPSMLALGENPTFVAGVSAAVGPEAGAVVVFVSEANRFAKDCSGGDLCKSLRRAQGERDHASCAALCAETPKGSVLVRVNISNRSGSENTVLSPSRVLKGYENQSTGDWSGWRNVVATRTKDGRYVVCGTGTNWSSDQDATKVLRIYYN